MSAPAGYLNPMDAPYSAPGTSSSNNSTAVQNCLDDCASQGKSLWVPYTGQSWRLDSGIVIPVGVSARFFAGIDWNGGTSGPVVTIGETGVANPGIEVEGVNCDGERTWPGGNDIGVRAYNPQGCRVVVMRASKFTRGFQMVADGGLEAHSNYVEFGYMPWNRYTAELDARASSYLRDNVLVGGRLAPTTPTTLDREDWRLVSSDGTSAANIRNNVWLKASCEGTSGNTGVRRVHMFCEGAENYMWSIRHEPAGEQSVDRGIVANGSDAAWNLLMQGQQNGSSFFPNGLENGAPSNRTAVTLRRFTAANIAAIGGIQS